MEHRNPEESRRRRGSFGGLVRTGDRRPSAAAGRFSADRRARTQPTAPELSASLSHRQLLSFPADRAGDNRHARTDDESDPLRSP